MAKCSLVAVSTRSVFDILLLIISSNAVVFLKMFALWTLDTSPSSVSAAPVNALWLNKLVPSANSAPLMSVLV